MLNMSLATPKPRGICQKELLFHREWYSTGQSKLTLLISDKLRDSGGDWNSCDITCTFRVTKFKELAPFLLAKCILAEVKGKVYESCIRSCKLFDSETWPLKMEQKSKLDRNEMRMVR
jgi:hypothetical protein